METKLYTKVGRRYKEIESKYGRFYSDGIWIVEKNTGSAQMIKKVDEIPKDRFPFSQMCLDLDLLSKFLYYYGKREVDTTLKFNDDGSISYVLVPNGEMAREIFKFLSMTDEEKTERISELNKVAYIDFEGDLRAKDGRIFKTKCSKESLEARKEKIKTELDELEKRLKKYY